MQMAITTARTEMVISLFLLCVTCMPGCSCSRAGSNESETGIRLCGYLFIGVVDVDLAKLNAARARGKCAVMIAKVAMRKENILS